MELNLQNIIELISRVGFPIAVCIALFWFNRETIREQGKLLSELKDTIRDNTEVIRDVLDELKRR